MIGEKMEKTDRVAQLYDPTEAYKSHRLPSGWYKNTRALSLGVPTTNSGLSFVYCTLEVVSSTYVILRMYEDDHTSPHVPWSRPTNCRARASILGSSSQALLHNTSHITFLELNTNILAQRVLSLSHRDNGFHIQPSKYPRCCATCTRVCVLPSLVAKDAS